VSATPNGRETKILPKEPKSLRKMGVMPTSFPTALPRKGRERKKYELSYVQQATCMKKDAGMPRREDEGE
jgi:hypothetical protein